MRRKSYLSVSIIQAGETTRRGEPAARCAHVERKERERERRKQSGPAARSVVEAEEGTLLTRMTATHCPTHQSGRSKATAPSFSLLPTSLSLSFSLTYSLAWAFFSASRAWFIQEASYYRGRMYNI